MAKNMANEVIEGQIFSPQPMALEGIRVVDLTMVGAGPITTRLLGQLGAEILKIEQPGFGDDYRRRIIRVPVPPGAPPNAVWEDVNQNKKSVTIDLHKKEGQEILYKLIEKSDVFTSNLRPSALKKFNADYETLSKYNPKLIYVRGNVYGPKGPDADRPGYGGNGAARSAIMTLHNEYEDTHNPLEGSLGITDSFHAMSMAYGVLAALIARDRLGIGQEVTLSQVGATMNLLISNLVAQQLMWGIHESNPPRYKRPSPLSRWYQCKDKKWIMLGVNEEHLDDWHRLCLALGKPELEHNPKFKDWKSTMQNSNELATIFDEVFVTRTQAEWDAALRKEGVVWFCVINELEDLVKDPQVLANNYVWEVDHPEYGKIKFPGHPVTFTKTPATLRTFVPELGQHTEVVLMELLGYEWDQIEKLKEGGII